MLHPIAKFIPQDTTLEMITTRPQSKTACGNDASLLQRLVLLFLLLLVTEDIDI